MTSSIQQPHQYNQRILLAVTGLSPQVVTETLYALAVQQQTAFIPTEVHLITTAEGAERARLTLLSDSPGWFARLCQDYQLPPIQFEPEQIHILKDAQGANLDDIRTPADNEQAANLIIEIVRQLTANPDAALHVSIAGGRKTMGFYLGYAISLYGRPQDRLSHVLVSDPFEASWNFFYPTPYSQVIEVREQKLADTANARVTLAEIPFVRMRDGLPKDLQTGQTEFSSTVEAAQRALQPPKLLLDLKQHQIQASDLVISLPPASLALLALFAQRAKAGKPPISAPPKGVPDPEWRDSYLAIYRQMQPRMADMDETERALKDGMDGDYFSSQLSRLHRQLKQALGLTAVKPYLIDNGGHRPYRYQLTLAAEAICFIN